MRQKYLSSIRDLAMTAKPVKAASRAVATPRQFALFA
jgi:hypothetical protein